jgi:hypothetical protein
MRARFLLSIALLTALLLPLVSRAASRLPKAKPAQSYANAVTQSGVAIAAVPFTSAAQQRVFAIAYRKFGFVPIRLIITNRNSRPISIAEVRVYLLGANHNRIGAATPSDVERAIPLSDKQGRQIPVGPFQVATHAKDSDAKVERDFRRYEYNALAVPAHSTVAGFIWFDVDALGRHPLAAAHLSVREVQGPAGQELFSFEIPLPR